VPCVSAFPRWCGTAPRRAAEGPYEVKWLPSKPVMTSWHRATGRWLGRVADHNELGVHTLSEEDLFGDGVGVLGLVQEK
jgi:hypothetical protein